MILADPAKLHAALQQFEVGRLQEAEAICEAILAGAPDDFWTLRLLGELHSKRGCSVRALHFLTRALAADEPGDTATVAELSKLAIALVDERQFAAAVECLRLVLARRPDDAVALHNHAYALVGLNRHAEALPVYRAARKLNPDSPHLKVNEGIALLGAGEWQAGWAQYEARLDMPHLFEPDAFAERFPRWRGDTDIAGKTILLQAEQGLGDSLQFVRYVPLVAALGARVVLRVQPPLAKILRGVPGADRVVTFADEPDGIDLQCRLMSLPAIFGTTPATVPASVPYLDVPREYLMLWRALLGPVRRKRIGIAWSGAQQIPGRSIPLEILAPLLRHADYEFHALQAEFPEADAAWLAANPMVVDHSERWLDFADAAALAASLDLVITIDTAMAHLAGALGLPTWIMLPFHADFRWLLDRADTPWYPTARLFRQQRPGDWEGVVAEVVAGLKYEDGHAWSSRRPPSA